MKIPVKRLAFMLCFSLAALQPALAENISIATGGTGGVYYPMGGGIAAVLSKHVPGMQATAEVTGGSVDNLKLIGSGKPYIALTMADAGQDAYHGEDKFKGNKVPLRTLMILYPNRMHVVTVEGRGIAKMADLKGKRVSTGSPGSATEVMAFRVIEAAGLDKDKDMKRERLGVAESVNAHQGRQDRRLLLGRRPADRGGHRPRQHARHQDQDDRPRRPGGGDEQEVRQPVRRGHDPQGHLQGHGQPTTSRRR